MATYKGVDGIVKLTTTGGTAVGELHSWNLDISAAIIETTAKGATARARKGGLKVASGSLSCAFDGFDDTAQAALTNGASATVVCFTEGGTTATQSISVPCIISNVKVDSPLEGDTMASFDFTSNGTITRTAGV